MTKIKDKWANYSIREKASMIIGTIVLCIQVFRYATNSLGENGVEIVVFGLSFLLMFAPIVIVELIKKKKNAP